MAQYYLLTHHNPTSNPGFPVSCHHHRPNIRNSPPRTIRNRHLAVLKLIKLKLGHHMRRNAKVKRACIHKRLHLNFPQLKLAGIPKGNVGMNQAHSSPYSPIMGKSGLSLPAPAGM